MPTRTTATATWDAPVVITFRCPKCEKDVSLTRYICLLIAVFLGLPIASIATLVTHLKKNKQHRQYAAGAREPFAAPSEEGMSHMAAYYMNKQAAGGREYLSIGQVKRMSRAMPF